MQILQPLIRRDKAIVYIDDIMIASESVDENLESLKETLVLLKQYRLELNYNKCQFLKREVQYLGYVINKDGMTLSPRHTEAIDKFPKPRTVHEVQRFLGLASYFRKFIENFALKAKPLSNLLRKDQEFKFNSICNNAFELLKNELKSYPVLS